MGLALVRVLPAPSDPSRRHHGRKAHESHDAENEEAREAGRGDSSVIISLVRMN